MTPTASVALKVVKLTVREEEVEGIVKVTTGAVVSGAGVTVTVELTGADVPLVPVQERP